MNRTDETQSNLDHETPAKRWSAWALAPVLLLAGLLSIQAVMVTLATDDPGFAVEDDYYRRAVEWDSHAAQRELNRQLGWQVQWQARVQHGKTGLLALHLTTSEGAPVSAASLSIEAFHNARSAQRQALTAREDEPGRYTAPFRLSRPGIWEFRMTATHEGVTFTDVVKLEVGAVPGVQAVVAPAPRGQ